MADPYDLERFVTAQAPVIEQARAELAAGRKTSHWMWFVFPQVAGLGQSAMSRRYAIGSRAEAAAYLEHPILGDRLRDFVRLLSDGAKTSPETILGPVDAAKLRSCLTLFSAAAPNEALFASALEKFFAGEADPATLARLDLA